MYSNTMPPHSGLGPETLAMDRLNLKAMEEALGTDVILAIAIGTHAAHQVVLGRQCLVQA